ncbi:MAG TPA: hypothetical protein PKL97_02920 [Candidatus Omnitrophota bacterium]|nr:hypothetical protein [Candidatus Omnitrophota bacterium]
MLKRFPKKILTLSFLAAIFATVHSGLAYIPDVGPGKCVGNCENVSSGSSGSSSSGGGYYNSYDAMMMNTTTQLMGSFMNTMFSAMSQASAQQRAYQQQVAEQQRAQEEMAREEQARLLALKKEEQVRLRSAYRDKLAASSASIKAGIARIESMLGLELSPDTGSLKLETFNFGEGAGIDWDGKRSGASSGTPDSQAPLEIMRDDFVDSNVVDLRDKQDLVVDPARVRGENLPVGYGEGAAEESAEGDLMQPVSDLGPSAVPVKPEGEISQIRQEDLSLPVVDPRTLKGDTPPIEPETIESLKRDRAAREQFEAASAERAEELRAEAQLERIREAGEADLKWRAESRRQDEIVSEIVREKYKTQMAADPVRKKAIEDAVASWRESEKEYDAAKQAEAAGAEKNDDELTFLLDVLDNRQHWPGPVNPEPPLPNRLAEEEERFKAVYNIWHRKNEQNRLRFDFAEPKLQEILSGLADEEKKKEGKR